jgi:hypothetical protein
LPPITVTIAKKNRPPEGSYQHREMPTLMTDYESIALQAITRRA